ncbi:N-acetyltransferase 6 [Oryzias melastigma]|uniref:N-acetyltransferase 6 n=1 Tax=Oryzias melastigma TaxID=30732 RepID=A0A834CIF1_ORYME|nr:N-acetyltransferase 6 [Oryzias melastigma]
MTRCFCRSEATAPPNPHLHFAPDRGDLVDEEEKVRLVPIHQRPDLLVPCADLVNSEWARSQAARVHSLQKSCSEFPVCLVLLQGHERLLGHARLSRVVGHGGSLFVESVVVSKEERGKGYGRVLMEETERYARRRGFKRLCLTTHDKQHFYAHLGYVLSTPVQNTGPVMALVPMAMLMRLSRVPADEESLSTKDEASKERSGGSTPPSTLPPPPLPPPSTPHPPPPSTPHPPPPPPPSTLPPPLPPPSTPPPPPPPPPSTLPPPLPPSTLLLLHLPLLLLLHLPLLLLLHLPLFLLHLLLQNVESRL